MKKITTIFIYLLSLIPAMAQVNYAGKDFWLTLGGTEPAVEYCFSAYGRLNIASRHKATVDLYFTNTGQIQTYTIPPDSVVTVVFTLAMNRSISNFMMEQVDTKSLHITSDSDVVVSYYDDLYTSSDGTTVLPTDNQQKADSFYLVSFPNIIKMGGGVFPFSIVATCDSVNVEITPVNPTYSHPAGIPFTVILRKGETYQLGGSAASYWPSLTGTKIKVSADCCQTPVNIFHHTSGLMADIQLGPRGICCADAPLEQVMPVKYFDTTYPVVTWAQNPYSPLRIFSTEDNNRLYFDRSLIRTLAKGEVFDTLITEAAVMVRAAKPISLAQIMLSYSAFNPNLPTPGQPPGPGADPELMYNAPVSQGVKASLFRTVWGIDSTLQPPYPFHYLTIMSRKANVPFITLNGLSVASYFKHFATNPEWQYAYIPLERSRTYYLKSNEKVVAYYYYMAIHASVSHNLPELFVDSQVINGGLPLVTPTDTLYQCRGESMTLTANNADTYEWITGESTAQITVYDTGYYWVKETHFGLCNNIHQLHGYYVIAHDTATLHEQINDTLYKCGSDLTLDAGDTADYLWSTGATTRQINVAQAGSYSVTLTRAVSACQHAVVIRNYYVVDKVFDIQVDIGNDTVICMGDHVLLSTNAGTAQWSTGAVSPSLMVSAPGLYKASVVDSCGNVYTDSVMIHMRDCSKDRDCSVNFPTAFTPNSDGINDVFRPISIAKNYNSYYIAIYDRWGEMMFDSHDPKTGWDGRYKGKAMPDGVYMYMCTVNCTDTGKVIFKGDITLVK